MEPDDVRVRSAIFTPKQVALMADMPISTVYSWMRPTANRPALIHRVQPRRRGWASIPLIGAAEAVVLRPLRTQNMRMPEIAAAVQFIRERGGEYALGNPDLLHDGVLALRRGEAGNLETLRNGQGVIDVALAQQLQPFRLAPDGFVEALVVNGLPETEIDPRFSAGRPFFTKTGIPVFAVAGLLQAGESVEAVAREYDIEPRLVRAVEQADPAWLSQVA